MVAAEIYKGSNHVVYGDLTFDFSRVMKKGNNNLPHLYKQIKKEH
jgi:hypothetical protein